MDPKIEPKAEPATDPEREQKVLLILKVCYVSIQFFFRPSYINGRKALLAQAPPCFCDLAFIY